MLQPLESESFVTQGLSAKAVYHPTGGLLANPTTEKLEIGFFYDQPSDSYTITVEGRTQTFGPTEIETSLSNDQIVLYLKDTGDVVESLTLTKAGLSGPLTYQYVGAGVWERAEVRPDAINGHLDTFTYGMETVAEAVPQTGGASYSIDVLGARSTGIGIAGFSGTGYFDVDFMRGTFALRGEISGEPSAIPVTEFVGDGRLEAASNGFSGELRFFEGGTLYNGALNGRFYGPDAEELGAVWEATPSGIRGLDSLYSGAILGRREGALGVPSSFADLASNAFLDGAGHRMEQTGTGSASTAEDLIAIHYDSESGVYTVYDSQSTHYYGDPTGYYEADAEPGDSPTIEYLTLLDTSSLNYVRAGHAVKRSTRSGVTTARVESFHFGFPTAPTDVPQNGSAFYEIDVSARLLEPGSTYNPAEMEGEGAILADFGSGNITLFGNIAQPGLVGGAFEGVGAISSSSNGFTGGVSINTYAYGDMSGSFSGFFYGPSGSEVGGSMEASGASGSLIATMVGASVGPIPSGSKPLANYIEPVNTADLYDAGLTVSGNAAFVWNSLRGDASMIWDPAAGSYQYTFNPTPGSPDLPLDLTFEAANRNGSASTELFDVFSIVDGTSNYSAKVYRRENPEVALTYTSFFGFHHRSDSPNPGDEWDSDWYYFGLIGSPTPDHEMPRLGSASYAGVAYGAGVSRRTTSPITETIWDLNGTSMLQVDFQTLEANGSISLIGTDPASTVRDFGTFELDGTISSSLLNLYGPGMSNTMLGHFFGPDAAEYAAVFNIQTSDSLESTYLVGATLGVRD